VEPVRVLVVDDDEAFCEMMARHLRRKGFQVESAKDGLDAVQILRSSGPFCVMVTDLMMPGLSGLELLRRARKLDPLIEVIVITASGSIEMAISALREDGAYDYLTKPLEMITELSLAVDRAASHREMKLEREAIKGSLVNGTRRLKEILSCTGIPILAGNEKDELIHLSPTDAVFEWLGLNQEKAKKDRLVEPFNTLVGRWRSLGGKQVAWVETKWGNGEEILVRIAPLPMGESIGWVIVLQNITYLKRLERFIVRSYTKTTTRIQEPVEKAMVFVEDMEERYRQGEEYPLEHLEELKLLFEEAQGGAKDLLTLTRNHTGPLDEYERISLHEFLKRNQSGYQSERMNGSGENINWQLAEDLPVIEVHSSMASELLYHLLQHAKLRSKDGDEIQIKTWGCDGLVWLSVTDNGSDYYQHYPMTSTNEGSESHMKSFTQGHLELALAKLFAEKMGCQVWLQQVDNEALSVAVCFLGGEGESLNGSNTQVE
jgi:CheY-like chemotaxis protein